MFERMEQNRPPISETSENKERISREMNDFYLEASCAMKNSLMELEAEIQTKSFGQERDEAGIQACRAKQEAIQAGLDLIASRREGLGVITGA